MRSFESLVYVEFQSSGETSMTSPECVPYRLRARRARSSHQKVTSSLVTPAGPPPSHSDPSFDPLCRSASLAWNPDDMHGAL